MTYIFPVTIFIHALAVVWSLLVFLQHRDRRILYLTLLLAVMLVRSVWCGIIDPNSFLRPFFYLSAIVEGILACVSVVAFDCIVASQREAIERSNLRSAKLEGILGTAADAIITIDARGVVLSANPATERLFGYPLESIVGQNVRMLMPAPYRDQHDGYIQNYLATGHQKIIGIGREVAGLHQDGTTFPLYLAVSESVVGGHSLFTGIVRDLSQLRSAEAEQASLGRVLEESLNEIYFFDAKSWKLLQVNRGARENLGYGGAALCDMTPLDIARDMTAERFRELLSTLRAGSFEQLRYEAVHYRADGTKYDVEIHVQLSQILRQSVFVAIALDITSRKELERERTRINEELEQRVRERTEQLRIAQAELVQKEKLATLGQVSGGIAHEIRNPLNAVKTSAYFLVHAKNPSREKTLEHLHRIDRQVTLIDNVITALSDVARLPEATLAPLSLSTCLDSVVRSVTLPANVKIVTQFSQDLPQVYADTNQLQIAFRNLLRNACDAMPGGGTIEVTGMADAAMVNLHFRDHGTGISEAELPKIMEPLYSTKARGMGLGLAITKAIVEKNQGNLRVESQLGQGTNFIVGLPCVSDGIASQHPGITRG